jgi:hypothetical protein
MPERAKRYTRTPAYLVVRGIPVPRAGSVPTSPPEVEGYCWPEEIVLGAIHSGTVQAARAERDAEALLRWCRDRVRRGDRTALLDLLDLNPAFIADRWVREEVGRLMEGGLLARRRGRPKGRCLRHPLAVMGLIQYLIEMGHAANPEQAFGQCEALGILPYDTAKRCYYEARGDRRFRPILLKFPEYTEEVPSDDTERRTSHVLGPGVEVTATWADPRFGTVRIAFRGE